MRWQASKQDIYFWTEKAKNGSCNIFAENVGHALFIL